MITKKFKANITFYNYILLNIQNFYAIFKHKSTSIAKKISGNMKINSITLIEKI